MNKIQLAGLAAILSKGVKHELQAINDRLLQIESILRDTPPGPNNVFRCQYTSEVRLPEYFISQTWEDMTKPPPVQAEAVRKDDEC